MRIKCQVIRFRAVSLKESSKSLSGVHHTKITSIMYKFLVSVWRRCSRSDKPVRDTREQRQKLLIGLGAESAQHAGFIQ